MKHPKTEIVAISSIKVNQDNPRDITEQKMEKLKKSISDFPDMLQLRPIVIDEKNIVLGGNMRLRACQALGLTEVPIVRAENLTEEQKQEFIIKDNVGFGQWDWDILANEWDAEALEDWGLETPTAWLRDEPESKLEDRFLVPPFTILDTRQGYWQKRKSYWKERIGDTGESREGTLYKGGGKRGGVTEKLRKLGSADGVSLLDPVLAEITNHWFGLGQCNTFDCFAGDSVFGYVSDALGNTFTGIELRQEQVDLNNKRLRDKKSKYICDDGQNVLKHIAPASQDLLFSCPPYYDLEVYSDLENDASNQGTYQEFLQILQKAFTDSVTCLKDNRFAVITVGDIRDKMGFYYRFVDDIKDIFKGAGMNLLNELIILEPIGTTALRAGNSMKGRKVAKTHQNVLVFYKGDPREIKNIYPEIDFSNLDLEDEGTDV